MNDCQNLATGCYKHTLAVRWRWEKNLQMKFFVVQRCVACFSHSTHTHTRFIISWCASGLGGGWKKRPVNLAAISVKIQARGEGGGESACQLCSPSTKKKEVAQLFCSHTATTTTTRDTHTQVFLNAHNNNCKTEGITRWLSAWEVNYGDCFVICFVFILWIFFHVEERIYASKCCTN